METIIEEPDRTGLSIHQPYVYVGMNRQDLCAAVPGGTVFNELGEWIAAHDGVTLELVLQKLELHARWVRQAIERQAGVPC